jgi:hypothetical protein
VRVKEKGKRGEGKKRRRGGGKREKERKKEEVREGEREEK